MRLRQPEHSPCAVRSGGRYSAFASSGAASSGAGRGADSG
ncbi:hypothetical protein [Microbacterium hominis]